MQVEVDQITADDWSAHLQNFEDINIYQTRAYGEVRWGGQNLSHIVLKRDGEVAAMAQLRIIPLTRGKYGMAYLRWGPVLQRKGAPLDKSLATEMAAALRREYVQKRKMFLRIIPNACLQTERSEILARAFADYATDPFPPGTTYRTIVVDLNLSKEELRRRLDPKWRNKLNGAEKNNLTIFEGNDTEMLKRFAVLYREMHSRKQFGSPAKIEDFILMQDRLPPMQKMRVLICEQAGATVAAAVLAAMGNMGIYLHGATTDAGLKAKGSYLLQWRAMNWLQENGIRYYDLGGINPETNPGVFNFKNGMSGLDLLYMPPLSSTDNSLAKIVGRTAEYVKSRPWKNLDFLKGTNRESQIEKQPA